MQLAMALSASLAVAAPPQSRLPDLPAGTRVRVTSTELPSGNVAGRVVQLDSQEIHVAVTNAGTLVRVPWIKVADVSWSLGRQEGDGARRGAIVGGAVGIATFATQYAMRNPTPDDVRTFDYWYTISFQILPGVGALAGAAMAKESWHPAPIPRFPWTASHAPTIGVELGANEDVRRFPANAIVAVRGERDRVIGALFGATFTSLAAALVISEQRLSEESGALALGGSAFVGALIGSLFGPRKWIFLPYPAR
jgi:hypothetical protein